MTPQDEPTTSSKAPWEWALIEMGYETPTLLSTGEIAAGRRMLYTYGLFVGMNAWGYRTRFCYPNREEALKALAGYTGKNDPPGPWIKEKGFNRELNKPVDRSNPKLTEKLT